MAILKFNPGGRALVSNPASENHLSEEATEAEFLRCLSLKSWINSSKITDAAFFWLQIKHVAYHRPGNCEWEQ